MKKFMYLFNVFFDRNKSGAIDKKDFDIAAEKICSVRGWKVGDPQYEKTKQVLANVWVGLKEKADADNDGQVTCEEWCKMWEDYCRDPNSVLDWQNQFRDFMFDLEDTSGDGTIDEEEFTMICASYNIAPEESKDAFSKFTANGTVEINREKFGDLWVEYLTSEEPNAPGNFIFGVTKFE